jgi:hypothetical protein
MTWMLLVDSMTSNCGSEDSQKEGREAVREVLDCLPPRAAGLSTTGDPWSTVWNEPQNCPSSTQKMGAFITFFSDH